MHLLKQQITRLAKIPLNQFIWQYRLTTWCNRYLPHFIIIGAQKSGTTSLYYYLSQHPQLLQSFKKEVHFFDGGLHPEVDNYKKGQEWYRAHFATRKGSCDHFKAFEASPFYIFHPLAAKRIFKLVPEVKLIAVLRNPTERAISHYFHEKRKGRESLSINKALQEEDKRVTPVLKHKDYKNNNFIHCSYKHRGLYCKQLERFLKYYSWEHILVINSEELFLEPENTLKRVFAFVGVDTEFKVKDVKPQNVTLNRSDVDPKVYEYLNDYFAPHNQALYELIGKNYDW